MFKAFEFVEMIISGDNIPDTSLWCIQKDSSAEINSSELFADSKVVLFTLPGAFTPTCNNYHVPGFVKNASALRELGVDRIVCASVNDKYVMGAWANSLQALGEIDFLADFDARFAKALGLARDLSAGGLGLRFVRSAMIVKNSIVQSVFVDESGSKITNTGALQILDVLKGNPGAMHDVATGEV